MPAISLFLYSSLKDLKKKLSADASGSLGSDLLLIRQRKLIREWILKRGMSGFAFLLESCQPGSMPDPQLIAAILDLVSPWIRATAAFTTQLPLQIMSD